MFVGQEQWRLDRDASSEAAHGPSHPLCEEGIHILRYHVETPFFIREDLENPNHSATNRGTGWYPNFTNNVLLPASVADFKDRVTFQARTLFGNHSVNGIPVWVFAPTCRKHVGVVNNDVFLSRP